MFHAPIFTFGEETCYQIICGLKINIFNGQQATVFGEVKSKSLLTQSETFPFHFQGSGGINNSVGASPNKRL